MTEELLSNSFAAQTLSQELPDKTAEQWLAWLQNNRTPSRPVTYRVPFVKMMGGVFYRSDDIAKFIELEKSRQLGTIKLSGRAKEALDAFGIGTATGSTTGQRLNVTGINPQIDQATGKGFVQMIVTDPLRVYRLELDQAKTMAAELNEATQYLQRLQASTAPQQSDTGAVK